MSPRDVQHRFAEFLAALINAEHRSKIPQIEIRPAIVGLFRKAERDRVRMLAANARGMGIVRAIKNRADGLIQELRENRFDRGKVGIKIEVLFLDV